VTLPAPARTGARSKEATRLCADLIAAPVPARRRFLATLTERELAHVLAAADRETGTPWGIWRDDPIGFIEDVLGTSLWSKPKEILEALRTDRRVAVPSCFSSSKTFTAARLALWHAYTHPVGTTKVVTLAPTWRQVARLLWAEIRTAHSQSKLPGTADMVQLKIPDHSGNEIVAAYGLAAPPWNENAVQGVHAQALLLIVDEAGGIGHVIGNNLRGMLTGEDTKMLAIGNPPTDEEDSWFENLCSLPEVTTIPISAMDTPNLSGEQAPVCRTCQGGDAHTLARHLVDRQWVAETIAEHGDDARYTQSKVYARFPKGGPNLVIPAAWIDAAAQMEEPEAGADFVRLDELDLPGESAPWRVRRGSWIRLGVDVAAGGGDEFVVARAVGDLVEIRHTASGSANTHAMDVAGKVLDEIHAAGRLARAIGSSALIRVKVDAIGVGWGVAGILRAWAAEEVHDAEIVPVVVSEKTDREPDTATMHPNRKRDEMWLAMRSLLQPTRDRTGTLRLRLDKRTLAQLRTPTLSYISATGKANVESKTSMKARGVSSPDRAEAVLLTVFEPAPLPRKKAFLIA
jgi:hypothetical protein